MNDDLLIQRYLDGALNACELAALNQRLREDAALRDQVREIAEQAVAMGDFARSAKSPEVARPAAMPARFSWLALAASIALLATSAWLWLGNRVAPVLTLVDASGTIAWSSDGEWRVDVSLGQKLAAGTIETVGESATALLQFSDGTLLTLSGDSELSFSEEGQKMLVLRNGSLSAQVKPQPKDKPMLVRTASAEAQVVGTVFNLAARTDDTLLKVEEGLVKLKRLADGSSIDVPAKSTAVASLDSALKLDSAATSEPLTDWSFDFTTTMPPRDWRGISDGSHMVASPYIAARQSSGHVVTHFGISVRTAQLNPPLALIATDTSVIRYRLKQDQPAPLLIMLLTSKPRGEFGGNFEVKLGEHDLRPDRHGWCEIAIPLTAFKAIFNKHPSPTGNILNSVLISSFQKDTQLTVEQFRLEDHP
jgi:ferric-dicitrate binding protein FerR (iron transport regulator)